MYQRTLVPIDGGSTSLSAFQEAIKLAAEHCTATLGLCS